MRGPCCTRAFSHHCPAACALGLVAAAVLLLGVRAVAADASVGRPELRPALTATPTPPVWGRVDLEVAAEPTTCQHIELRGVFTATSQAAPVTEMRFDFQKGFACEPAIVALADSEWTQFVPTRAYTTSGGPHYFNAVLAVQYRSGIGQVSPPACDTIFGVCMGTPTQLPPVEPTPEGGPIEVGPPLATPRRHANAVGPHNVSSLVERAQLESPTGDREHVVGFTRDGSRLVTHSGYRYVHQRRMPDAELINTLSGVQSSTSGGMELSPDGKMLAVANQGVQGEVEIRDLLTGALLRRHRGGREVRHLEFSSDGRRLVAAREDGSMTLWAVADGELIADEQVATAWQEAVFRVHPLQSLVATGHPQGALVDVRDLQTFDILFTLIDTRPSLKISALHFRPDGESIVAATGDIARLWGNAPHELILWHDRQVVARLGYSMARHVVSWSPTGKQLVIAGVRGSYADHEAEVSVWNLSGDRRILLRESSRSIRGVAWSPDGTILAVATARTYGQDGKFPGETALWDPSTRRELRRLPTVIEPWFAPDGAQLVVRGDGDVDDDLRLFAVDDSRLSRAFLPRVAR